METKIGWLQTERSYYLGKLEPLVDIVEFKALAVNHTERVTPKHVRPRRSRSSFSSDWDDR